MWFPLLLLLEFFTGSHSFHFCIMDLNNNCILSSVIWIRIKIYSVAYWRYLFQTKATNSILAGCLPLGRNLIISSNSLWETGTKFILEHIKYKICFDFINALKKTSRVHQVLFSKILTSTSFVFHLRQTFITGCRCLHFESGHSEMVDINGRSKEPNLRCYAPFCYHKLLRRWD